MNKFIQNIYMDRYFKKPYKRDNSRKIEGILRGNGNKSFLNYKD